MNSINNYPNSQINFKALNMPKRQAFRNYGKRVEWMYGKDMVKQTLKEIESIRPELEKIAVDNPDVDCFFAPNNTEFPNRINLAAYYRNKLVHYRLNLKQEVEYAERKSITLGEHFVNLLKSAIKEVKPTAKSC